MKMNNVLAKTGLALAISAFTAGAAFAGTHSYVVPNKAVVLADEIFGAGSEDTLVAIPVTQYAVKGLTGAALGAGEVATVKYTLDKGAVFGEDLSDIQKWADSNATLVFGFAGSDVTVDGANFDASVSNANIASIVVDQGGAIGDNTVTFKITALGGGAGETLQTVDYGQVRVKNLTSALQRGVNADVKLGAEFRNVTSLETDTQVALTVLGSKRGVDLTGTFTDYTGAPGLRARINVANNELKFTGALGLASSNDFDADASTAYVNLGTAKIIRTTYDNGTEKVKKENGDEFDFQGSDTPSLTLTSSQPVTAYSNIYLRAGAACDATPVAADLQGVLVGNTATINLVGQTTTQLEAGYNVCAVAGGQAAIPEATFDAQLNVTYFNPRYTDSTGAFAYGPVLRNGCQVTLFNLPNVNAQDKAMIRLTNVSDNPGSVRGFVWTEDGRQIDAGSLLSANLAAHATTVFHTNPSLNSGVYLGDVMSEFAGETTGRHRLVLQGAFPACEALGMVRSPNGTLVNMTSTTYSGSDAVLGTEQSNTSNTTN